MPSPSADQQLRAASIVSDTGVRVCILNLGATIAKLEVPTKDGLVNVVLSYDDLDAYRRDRFYLGATVGPFANRIRDAAFVLDGRTFQLEANEESTGHCLHGGGSGLHHQLFDLSDSDSKSRIECETTLPDGYGGFPGNRVVNVGYELLDDWALAVDFKVTTDRATVLSLANHAYFNLGGNIDDYDLRVQAEYFTPVDATSAPTGELRSTTDTPFDLCGGQLGVRRIDHNFVLQGDGELALAATLRSPKSGIGLKLHTTQPGLQVYTGDYLQGEFAPRQGLCLEAQGFPDAPNQEGFPSAVLAAGSTYTQRTIYAFDVGA